MQKLLQSHIFEVAVTELYHRTAYKKLLISFLSVALQKKKRVLVIKENLIPLPVNYSFFRFVFRFI